MIHPYQRFRDFAVSRKQSGDAKPQEAAMMLLRVDEVFREMRVDLELDNDGLDCGALIRLFLSDPETLDQESSSS